MAAATQIDGPLPRYARIVDFLTEGEVQQLYEWALSSADCFRPATVSRARSRVDTQRRIALTSAKLGPLETVLRLSLLRALPQIMTDTGTAGTSPTSLELELAAHGDGAFYGPHLDIPVGASRQATGARQGDDRVLSAVFYFHAQPQQFLGGQLRLFRFGAIPAAQEPQPVKHVDLEPVRKSLVAFPSWVPHEVRPIGCPSGKFRDYRFAVNCWYCRPL